jgi:hypothetical protein
VVAVQQVHLAMVLVDPVVVEMLDNTQLEAKTVLRIQVAVVVHLVEIAPML